MENAITLFDLTPGKLLAGRFEIVKTSRQGGLSAALEVKDHETNQRRELQLFPYGLFEGDNELNDFIGTWKPWTTVAHSTVLGFHGVIRLDGSNLSLVTDLPNGTSLRTLLAAGRKFTEAEVVALGIELCDGLIAIHEAGLVHGDVKPTTIFIDEGRDGEQLVPTLVDGGVTSGLWTAKHLGDNTALIGTPFYAPVEQFGGEAPDVLSDIYNLSTVLYELAAGVLPWEGTTFLEVFQAKLEPKAPRIEARAGARSVSKGLDDVLGRGLSAKREQRPSSVNALRTALSDI
ncbi:MAG: serine/threonine-protein kinase [Planctomycetota bacterium]|nr:serine/threonine-protein kinase [Planctomycetota bacterium]